MTEATTAHLPERNAACGDHRSDRDRDLVPDIARRVLVDDAAPESTREVDRLAARHHRIGQGEGLGRSQTAEPDRHQKCRCLVVGHIPADVAGDEFADLSGGELLSVPLALDQGRGVHPARAYSSGSTTRRSASATSHSWPRSQRSASSSSRSSSLCSRATHATVILVRCQRSWWSTSATAAPTRFCSCALAERRWCRFSFSECASGKCSSQVSTPTKPLATAAAG